MAHSACTRSVFMTTRTEKVCIKPMNCLSDWGAFCHFLFWFLFFFSPVVLMGHFSAALCELRVAKTTGSSLPHFQEEARWRWNWWIDGWRIVKQTKTEEAWLPEIKPPAHWPQGVMPITLLPTLMVTMGTSDALQTGRHPTDVHLFVASSNQELMLIRTESGGPFRPLQLLASLPSS